MHMYLWLYMSLSIVSTQIGEESSRGMLVLLPAAKQGLRNVSFGELVVPFGD